MNIVLPSSEAGAGMTQRCGVLREAFILLLPHFLPSIQPHIFRVAAVVLAALAHQIPTFSNDLGPAQEIGQCCTKDEKHLQFLGKGLHKPFYKALHLFSLRLPRMCSV